VLSLNMTPVQFMILSQAIIFVLGWPLEWTEIIIIFVPIFLPMLKHFNIDPILWGTLVFVNLQAAFLSPPVAMSAFYLKGVAPKHVTLNQIFAGMMPYMLIVILCMVIMYLWPGMTLWLPNYLYGIMQAVIFGMFGISELQRRNASPVHICCASALKAKLAVEETAESEAAKPAPD
jgi:TRAP-type mannitol/chloroaromatic compound transport system permease large subunit